MKDKQPIPNIHVSCFMFLHSVCFYQLIRSAYIKGYNSKIKVLYSVNCVNINCHIQATHLLVASVVYLAKIKTITQQQKHSGQNRNNMFLDVVIKIVVGNNSR